MSASTSNGIYQQNNRNLQPRLGIAWNLSPDGRTVVRAAYGRAADEPGTTAVRDTAGNPPFAAPLTATGSIPLVSAIDTTGPAGLSPATVDFRFRNASMQSWNANVQRQLARDLAATIGYSGSHGTNLRISRNLNQPVGGVRPFPVVAASSPILPGTPLGNITQVESSGFSNYHAVWAAVTKRLSRGLHADASYTWSKSLDTNSLNSSGFAVQDGYDIPNQYGLSDFDARHRFVVSATYVAAVHGPCPDARMAAGHGHSVAERQSREHRHQQQQPEWCPEHRASRCHRTDTDHRFGGSVVRSVGVRGRQSLRQPGTECRDWTGLQQCGRVVDQERAARRAPWLCSFEWMRSTSSTIPTSARRAISSAARRSARLRGRDCPRAKRAHPARFNWPCGCPSEMEVRMRARVVLALAATLCACTRAVSAEAQGASPRTVLTIHSGAENFPSQSHLWMRASAIGWRQAPTCPSTISPSTLESDLFPGEEASLAFKDYLRRKYQGRTIDVVIAMTDTSLRFVLDHRGELFPDAPVIFFGIAGPDETIRSVGAGITGIRIGIAYAETLKLALALHP